MNNLIESVGALLAVCFMFLVPLIFVFITLYEYYKRRQTKMLVLAVVALGWILLWLEVMRELKHFPGG